MMESRPRLLVVDDVADAADSQALLLRMWGYDAQVAYDGATAVKVAQAFRPRVVLLDIGLPKMDGFQIARLLRELPGLANVRLIAVSWHTGTAHRIRAFEMGFVEYLVKPTDPERLCALVAELVARPQSRVWAAVARSPRRLSAALGVGD